MNRFYKRKKEKLFLVFIMLMGQTWAQGNRLSIQSTPPKTLSICGVNDSAAIEVYNISSGTVANLTIKLILAPGINYVRNSVTGTGLSESNVSNLNQPVFTAPDLAIAKNFKFRVLLTADCNLLSYLNANNTPVVNVRVDYTGNFDLGTSILFSVKVPSVQFNTVTNLSFSGDIGTRFTRSITIGNYGKGPLRQITLKRINGKDISTYFVNKGVTTKLADTVTTIFGSTFFKTIGNLDSFLDQNETITLTDSNLIKGCKNLNTNFELSWTCNGKSCQVSKTSGSVIISNNAPKLLALPFPAYPTCFYNNTNRSELRFVNAGNMAAKQPRVSISLYYPYMTSTFDTASVRIKVGGKGKWIRAVFDSITGTYNQGYYGCIGAYPIGFFRLKSPDLQPNDTLFIAWDTKTCTPPPCTNSIYVVNSWAYYAEYRDQCNNLKTIPWNWGKVYDYHYFVSSSFMPTDFVSGQTGEFRTLITSANLLPVTSSASYVVDLILPPGLTHSKLKKDFYFINAELTKNWDPDSLVLKGDTLRGYFPHPIPINLTNSELVFYLKGDCSRSGANGIQNIGMQIRYSPDKNCSPREWHYLACQNLQTKLHCTSNCNGGMKFRNFSVQRTSFGKPDNNNDGIPDASGVLDTLKVREERCFVGDTIMATYHGKVLRTSSIISWRNAYIESIVTNGSYLDIAGIQLLVYRRGVTLSLNCNQVKSWKSISGNNATFRIDLSTDSLPACVSSSFRYNINDSLVIKVKYRVGRNIGGTTATLLFNNRFYTSDINNPVSNNNKFQCDTFSGQMIISGYYFTTCCSDVYQVNSCNEIAVNNYFYLGIGPCCSNYGGNNYFPYEYRNFAKLRSVKLNIPQGYKFKSAFLGQYRTSGSNATVLQAADSIKPVNKNASPVVFEVSRYYKDSAKGVLNLSDDAFHGYFVTYLEPTCEVQGTESALKYDFIFERKGTLGNGSDTIAGVNDDKLAYSQPTAGIQATSPTIYAAQDTAEWELVYTNYSSTFSNINSWFASDNSGAVKLVQVLDAKTDTLLPVSNGIFKVGIMPFNTTRKFKIRAIYNTCNRDSLILYSGWNCQDYPKDLAGYNCRKDRTALYLEPQNTQYQVTLSDSLATADLCATTPYTCILENIGATTGYNTKAILNLPIGMKVVPGSCYIKYPAKAAAATLPSPTLKSGTTYEWDLAAIQSNIKSGFKGVNDTNRNKIIIYFRVKTDCDYSSGNYIRASASGNIKCGNSIVTYPSISNPLNIKGVTRPYYTLLKVVSDSIFPCEKPTRAKIRIINLGPGKTGIEDKYQAILLPGMNYDSTLYKGVYNSPDNSFTRSRNINGATEVEFSLKQNIASGDSMEFEMGYHSDGRYLNCGGTDFYSQAVVKQEVICISDSSKCKINVVTGSNLIKPSVVKGNIVFSQLKADILNTSLDSETLKLTYRITNVGSPISNWSLIYQLSYDRNNSGNTDPGDITVGKDTLSMSLGKNGYTTITKTLKLKAGQSCALFISLDSASCSCSFNASKFPVPLLRNAGNTQVICSGNTVTLGKPGTNAFRYLWIPSADLKNDTSSQTAVKIENFDTTAISRRYVLTTYRGLCTSRDTVDIKIYNLPDLSFLQKDTGVCEGKSVMLKAASNMKGCLIRWRPGNLVTDSTSFVTVTRTSKTQIYTAIVKDGKGCSRTDSMKVTIYPAPKINFGYEQSCQGYLLHLKDSSQISGDSIIFNKWYNLQADTVNTKDWSLDLGGKLQTSVKLEIKSSMGCIDSLRKNVYQNPLPKAAFTSPDVCYGDSITTNNASSVLSGSIVKHIWSTGDGKHYIAKNIRHLYAMADTFNLQLVIETDKNCKDTVTQPVIVFPTPKADFTAADVCLGDSSKLLNLSTIANDSIVKHQWASLYNSSSLVSPAFLYPRDSFYNVRLKVTSAFGCSDSISKKIYVHPHPASGFIVKPVCEKKASAVKNTSTIKTSSIASWKYWLSDGSRYSTPDFSHVFSSGDTFDIIQEVVSAKGCKDTITSQAIVYPKLVPDFDVNNICVSEQAVFTDKTNYLHTAVNKWKWSFGTTDSSLAQNPVYNYGSWGTYAIGLEVQSAEGCIYDTVKRIVVHPLPKPDFKDTNQCIDNQFIFKSGTSIPSGSAGMLYWYFGDNTTSQDMNPSHMFPAAGNYNVKLIAESDFGCRDSISKTIQSYPPVIVNFDFNNVCLGEPVLFRDQSVVPNSTIKKYDWSFGDGNYGSLKDPQHVYKLPGNYMVKLSITTRYNCSYDSTHEVKVYPVPKAFFSTDTDQGSIVNPQISITDLSSGADTIWYDLGDGKTSGLRHLVKNYPDSGVFYIRQIAGNHYGCIDSFTKKIVINYLFVFNAPTAFSPNNDGINDLYAPGGIGIGKYEMRIFSRWGELLYFTDNATPWDGNYQGAPVMDGVYAVSFRVRDFKGIWHYSSTSFVLLR